MDASPGLASPRRSESWTGRVRELITSRLPMDHLLPHRQPYCVGSWVYVFGVITIAALVWVIVSGVVLVFFGPQWWHVAAIGRFFTNPCISKSTWVRMDRSSGS